MEKPTLLLKSNLKALRLPTMSAEHEKLAREASAAGHDHEEYLLRLTELEVAARTANACKARIQAAGFPVHKDLDTFDFSAVPALNKQKVLELTRTEWLDKHDNAVLLGSAGTGKPRPT
jgi:DNA replication protein DnaC